MKILFPIIALLLVGCKKSPEEMVVGEWKMQNSALETIIKFRADGIFESSNAIGLNPRSNPKMGEWKIVERGIIETQENLSDGKIYREFFSVDGPSKLTWYAQGGDDSDGPWKRVLDQPRTLYRVVE